MIITITQYRPHHWVADSPELCGSPITGSGHTWKEALGDLALQTQGDFFQGRIFLGRKVEISIRNADGTPYKVRVPKWARR